MIQKLLAALAPHLDLILGILGLVFLVAAAWTFDPSDLNTTLGLAATGLAFWAIEWRIS